MSRSPRIAETDSGCFPRVSGDEPLSRELVDIVPEFSPRERG